jgi:hypothetical protein
MTMVAGTVATLPELMRRAGHASPNAALHCQNSSDDAQQRIADRLDEAPGGALAGCLIRELAWSPPLVQGVR